MKENKCQYIEEHSSWWIYPYAKTINFYCTLLNKCTDDRICAKCQKMEVNK
jgi:hypothetical protein